MEGGLHNPYSETDMYFSVFIGVISKLQKRYNDGFWAHLADLVHILWADMETSWTEIFWPTFLRAKKVLKDPVATPMKVRIFSKMLKKR